MVNYKLINEALENIHSLRSVGSKFKKVVSDLDSDTNELTEVYELGLDNLHIKIVLQSDSYGENEFINSIQIVKPVIKQITDFETI